jgi:hypothetical protein
MTMSFLSVTLLPGWSWSTLLLISDIAANATRVETAAKVTTRADLRGGSQSATPGRNLRRLEAGVFAPALIEEIDAPVRKRSPYQSGKRINDAAKFVFHTGPFATVAVTEECATPRANVDDTLVSVCHEALALPRHSGTPITL